MSRSSEDRILREHLAKLLTGKQAHVDFGAAVSDLPFELQGRKPKGASHTPWEILEHLRIAQWDILEFSRNPKHVSPNFPVGYWPEEATPPESGSWERSVALFQADLGDVPTAVEFGRVATAPVNTLRQQTHRCQEISVCF